MRSVLAVLSVALVNMILLPNSAMAQAGLPAVIVDTSDGQGQTWSLSLQALVLMTTLTLLPAMLLLMTSFTRIMIVLGILRTAMGTQQTPSNHSAPPQDINDVSFWVLVPAFVTSELKTAFQIGFMLFIPFLIIDLVVASVLMSMGMMMLSPLIISLPFKLMLFVLVDGWNLVLGTLAGSFFI